MYPSAGIRESFMNKILKLSGFGLLSLLSVGESGAMQSQPAENQAAQVRAVRLSEIKNFFKNNKRPLTRKMNLNELKFYNGVLSRIPALSSCFHVYTVQSKEQTKKFLTLNLNNTGMYEFGSIMNKVLTAATRRGNCAVYPKHEIQQKNADMHRFIRQVLSNTMVHH